MTTRRNYQDSQRLRWTRATLFAFLTAALMIPAGYTAAAEPTPGPPRKPPAQAFDACKGKKADDTCQVTFRMRTIDGKCLATPEGTLACRPERPPGLRKAMVAACETKKEGDACHATMGDRTLNGTCKPGRHGHRLVCRP